MAVEARLRTLTAPTLIVWGTDDMYFDVRWSQWLAETIPGTRGGSSSRERGSSFPKSVGAEFNRLLRAHWTASPS